MQEGEFKVFLCGHRDKKALLSCSASCKKEFFVCSSFGGPEAPLFFYIHISNFLCNLAHLNHRPDHRPDIAMVYSLHGCVQIFIIFIFGERGGGVCQIGHYLQYIYFLIFALGVIVCFILYFAVTCTSFFMCTLFVVSFSLFRGNAFGYLEYNLCKVNFVIYNFM